MKTQERLAFITEIAKKDANIGKTGMMKLLYLLQEIYDVPFGYDFEIYTYGPYCQTVMSDLEYAEFADYVKVSPITYPTGISGYQISTNTESEKVLTDESELLSQYSEEINRVISSFGDKTAKELELYSTIVFVSASYSNNAWEKTKEEICSTVRKIKPHFTDETILAAYDDLNTNHFLGKK